MTKSVNTYINLAINKIIEDLETEDQRYYSAKDFEYYIRETLEDDCLEDEGMHNLSVALNGLKWYIIDKLADWFIEQHLDILDGKAIKKYYKVWITQQEPDTPLYFLEYSKDFLYDCN